MNDCNLEVVMTCVRLAKAEQLQSVDDVRRRAIESGHSAEEVTLAMKTWTSQTWRDLQLASSR